MMMIPKRYIALGLPLTAFTLAATSCRVVQAENLSLANGGATKYQIAVPASAGPVETNAARQLQKYLQQVTGAHLAILPEAKVKPNAPQILVGAGQRVKRLLPKQDWKALGPDGIVIKTVGDKLVLAGGQPRGSLYAVFQFLEESAGCRFWAMGEYSIPKRKSLSVTPQNVTYVPPFRYREHLSNSMSADPVFAAISGENGHFSAIPTEWGGHYNILGFCHTYLQLLPPEKYFKEHPEWYSDPDNGYKPCTPASKFPKHTDLCVSNPGVLKELSKNALEWIRKNPEAGYISISESDMSPYCHCPECDALAKSEGTQAGPTLKFANAVAEIIHREYPDFLVETLAYNGSEKPPKTIRPGKNVIIRMAPISTDYGHLIDSDWNKDVRDNIKNWSKIAPNLFIWNYVTNFTHGMLPHPNWDGLQKDLAFFAANNVKGVFQQGDSFSNDTGDFTQLRTWMLAKLLWNPKLDQQKLRDTFMRGYYGPAAPFLEQYLDGIQASYRAQNRKLSTFNEDFSYLSLDVLNQSTRLFDSAAAAVKNDKVLSNRVARERLALDLAWLYRGKSARIMATLHGKEFLGPRDPQQAVDNFVAAAKARKVTKVGEGKSLDSIIPTLKEMAAAQSLTAELPEFAKAYPPGDVIDLQQDSFYFYGKGVTTDIVDDAAASDRKAAVMNGNAEGWLIQAQFDKIFDASLTGRWHTYVMMRASAKDGKTTGNAFQAGIFDNATGAGVSGLAAPLEQVAGTGYFKIDLGIQALKPSMYVWFGSTGNTAVDKFYIDRIILVREPETRQ